MAGQIDPDDPTVRTAVFGEMVRDFLKSDIGVYLLSMAEEEERAAIEQMIDAKPGDDLTDIRSKIRTARWFKTWLANAIQSGDQALQILQEE